MEDGTMLSQIFATNSYPYLPKYARKKWRMKMIYCKPMEGAVCDY